MQFFPPKSHISGLTSDPNSELLLGGAWDGGGRGGGVFGRGSKGLSVSVPESCISNSFIALAVLGETLPLSLGVAPELIGFTVSTG